MQIISSHEQIKKVDMVLCRIYRKPTSQKSIEEGTNLDSLDKEKLNFPAGDESSYEYKCDSITFNGSSCQSNPMTEINVSSSGEWRGNMFFYSK